MSEQLLALLRIGLLVLLYLFFLRVLHAVWVEVHGPRRGRAARAAAPVPVAAPAVPVGARPPLPAPAPRATAVPVLRIVEPAELAGRTVAVDGVVTIGRAGTCLLQLDDTYVSQLHARVVPEAAGIVVEDLGSTNGTYVNRAKVTAPVALAVGDRLQVGNVVLELA